MAAVSAMAPSWGSLPRLQLGLGVAVFGVVALVTLAPVLVVVAGAFADNVWYETFIGSTANRSAIGYSFLLALRAPVAAFIGFLIAWRMDSTQGFHAIMNLVLIPMWLLSGAFFPAAGATPWLRLVMALNPLTYGLAALRHCLYVGVPAADAGIPALPISLLVTFAFAAIAFWAARAQASRPLDVGLA